MKATTAPVIEIRDLLFRYGQHVIHRNLNLTVNQGEILALVGGSGSGKTTLLRQIIGLETPAGGVIEVFGENIQQMNHLQKQALQNRWGMLFQQGALFSALTVFDNVALPMRELRALPEHLIQEAVLLKLDMVGLTPEHANKMPADLSGGMIKRVALARALALEPELLFLDEPTAGLDPHLSDAFVDLISSLHQKMNLTVIMVTHDLDTICTLATQIAVLAENRVVAKGPLNDVITVDHPFIHDFFLGARGQRVLSGLDAENNPQQKGAIDGE